MSRRDWGDDLAAGATFVVLVLAIAAAIALATFFIAVCTELAKIFVAHAFRPSHTRRFLWIALGSLVALWFVAVVLATQAATVGLAAAVGAWSFLAFVIVCEGCQLIERRRQDNAPQLEDEFVLTPSTDEPRPHANGAHSEPIQAGTY